MGAPPASTLNVCAFPGLSGASRFAESESTSKVRFPLYDAKPERQHGPGTSRARPRLCARGLVAFPTETAYGLGAEATNDQAVARIFAARASARRSSPRCPASHRRARCRPANGCCFRKVRLPTAAICTRACARPLHRRLRIFWPKAHLHARTGSLYMTARGARPSVRAESTSPAREGFVRTVTIGYAITPSIQWKAKPPV